MTAAVEATITSHPHGHQTASWRLSAGQVGAWVRLIGDHWTVHVDGDGTVTMEGANAPGAAGAPLLDPGGLEVRMHGGQINAIGTGTVWVRPVVDAGEEVDVHLTMRNVL